MTPAQTRKRLRELFNYLLDLHAELHQLQAASSSPETRRLFHHVIEQCIVTHRLIVATIQNATRQVAPNGT